VNESVLIRKVFKVGDSRVVALPPDWSRDVKYVAIKPHKEVLVITKVITK
jgi:virulence-associated protein VagC